VNAVDFADIATADDDDWLSDHVVERVPVMASVCLEDRHDGDVVARLLLLSLDVQFRRHKGKTFVRGVELARVRDELRRIVDDEIEVYCRRADEARAIAPPERTPTSSVVYFIRSGHSGPIKIGIASDVKARLRTLQCASPEALAVLATTPGSLELERQLHVQFQHLRKSGEWFNAAPELLEFIAGLP
jgi:hypothetical protein